MLAWYPFFLLVNKTETRTNFMQDDNSFSQYLINNKIAQKMYSGQMRRSRKTGNFCSRMPSSCICLCRSREDRGTHRRAPQHRLPRDRHSPTLLLEYPSSQDIPGILPSKSKSPGYLAALARR